MWISVMENQEIDVIMFFYERGKPKADYIRNESAQMLVWVNSREYLRKFFFVVGTGSFIENLKVLKVFWKLQLMESISVNVR